jgi:hypothetical protein
MVERSEYEPGSYVRHPKKPEWGLGQVQSAVGTRVTVMFEHAGKVAMNTDQVYLEHLDGPDTGISE